MRNLWFVLVALLLVPASYAKTARELRDDCMAARRINKAIEKQASFRVERSEGEQAIFCYAYIQGMLDAFNDYARVQDTEETMVITVSAREEVEIFLRYAKANPSELDEQADRVLVNAFGAANKLRLGPKPKMPGYWPKEN